ncbi:transmembrane emp24 domain-containing protein 1-like [Oratosquilla oratoria]|uniref:transmembrane emp24 domain-containing protein 1-like n=1 Tax=Oratosquilla oratoria TaxID=337810 RepID=UPI003F770495
MMAGYTHLILVISTCFCTLVYARDIEKEMTVEVGPGTQECFYQDVKQGEILDVEYQVIDGGQGDLDIDFSVTKPKGGVIIQDFRKPEGSHRHTADEEGDYRICWDNTFSRFNSKTIFFGIMIENDNDDDDDEGLWDEGFENSITAEEVYEMKVDDIKDAMDRIRGHLTKSRFMQDQLRAYEARDRNVAESNYTRVNTWSLVNISVMIVTGLIQVMLLRSLFDEKSRFHRMWKKGTTSPYS